MPGAWPLLAETAELFELAGLHEEAATVAADAWSRGGPAILLQRAMRLALTMGDLETYAAAAARTVTVPGLDPLDAIRDRIAGRLEDARLGSDRILSSGEGPGTRLLAAWNLFAAAREGGTPDDVAEAAARITELFPGSPEAAIADAAVTGKSLRVVEAPSPSLFLSAGSAPKGPPPQKTFSVQAGSFQMRENADELVKDLTRAGFEPLIREAAVQGKTLYRVLAATGLDREAAARLLERLRTAGYAGITVND
jgi:cell division septation protein DedD